MVIHINQWLYQSIGQGSKNCISDTPVMRPKIPLVIQKYDTNQHFHNNTRRWYIDDNQWQKDKSGPHSKYQVLNNLCKRIKEFILDADNTNGKDDCWYVLHISSCWNNIVSIFSINSCLIALKNKFAVDTRHNQNRYLVQYFKVDMKWFVPYLFSWSLGLIVACIMYYVAIFLELHFALFFSIN